MNDARKADNPLKLILSFNKLKSLVGDLQKDFLMPAQVQMQSSTIQAHP